MTQTQVPKVQTCPLGDCAIYSETTVICQKPRPRLFPSVTILAVTYVGPSGSLAAFDSSASSAPGVSATIS